MTAKPHDLKPAQRCCVAEGVTTQRDILAYKRPYLTGCAFHRELWDAADRADRARESRRAEARA